MIAPTLLANLKSTQSKIIYLQFQVVRVHFQI